MKSRTTIYARFKTRAQHRLILWLCSIIVITTMAQVILQFNDNQTLLAKNLEQLDSTSRLFFVEDRQTLQDTIDRQFAILSCAVKQVMTVKQVLQELQKVPLRLPGDLVYGFKIPGTVILQGPDQQSSSQLFTPKQCLSYGDLTWSIQYQRVTQCFCLDRELGLCFKSNTAFSAPDFVYIGLSNDFKAEVLFTSQASLKQRTFAGLIVQILDKHKYSFNQVTKERANQFIQFVKKIASCQGNDQGFQLKLNDQQLYPKQYLTLRLARIYLSTTVLPMEKRIPLKNYTADIYVAGVPLPQTRFKMYKLQSELRSGWLRFAAVMAAVTLTLVLFVQQCNARLVFQLLEFCKFYDQLLRAACENSDYEQLYSISTKKYSWAEERRFSSEQKQVISNLRSFLWLVCNYPSQASTEYPFAILRLSERCLEEGMVFFMNKKDQTPFYQVSQSLVRLLESEGNHSKALSVCEAVAAHISQNLGAYQLRYENAEQDDQLRELVQDTVFRLYRNYLRQLTIVQAMMGSEARAVELQQRMASLELRYNIIPELQLEGLVLRIKISRLLRRDSGQLVLEATKFFNKVASKKSPQRPYQQIKEMHRLKQCLHFEILVGLAKEYQASPGTATMQQVRKELADFIGGKECFQGAGLVAVKYRTRQYFSPALRREALSLILKLGLARSEKDRDYIERCLRLYSSRRQVIVLLDCSQPFKEQVLFRILLKAVGKALAPDQNLQIYLYADNFVKLLGEKKERLQAISASEMLREIEQTTLRGKERRTIDCFTRLLRQQDFADCSTYVLLYVHELYPGGNEHLYQSSRRMKDRFIDLCLVVHNSFCQLLVASSLRGQRSESYSPDKLSFDAVNFHFLNGATELEIEQQFYDFLL